MALPFTAVERQRKDAGMEDLIALLRFAIVNEDKFTECDPDFVKRWWIESAKKAVELVESEAFDKVFKRGNEQDDERERQWLHDMGQGA